MVWLSEKTTGGLESKVKDLSEADVSIKIPCLIPFRDEFGTILPLKDAQIAVFSHKTTNKAVSVVEILPTLGARVRGCSCNISTEDHAAIARDSASIYPFDGSWRCIQRTLDLVPGGGLDLIIDDDGDATYLIHEGVNAENNYAMTGDLPDPSSPALTIIREGLKTDPMRYRKMKERLIGVSVDTTTGAERLYQLQADGNLMCTAISINNSVLNCKPINLYERSLSDMMGATDVRISGKKAVVIGYEDAAHVGCALALKHAGAYVVVFEVDPDHATKAVLRGFRVVTTLDDVVSMADVFVIVTTGTINKGNIIIANYTKKMKDDAVIFNMDASNIFPETNSSNNTGYPNNVVMLSWSCASHVVALLDLWSKKGSGEYEKKVYALAEHLEEKVSALHLAKLKTTAEKMTDRRDGHVSLPMGELGSGFTTSTEPKKIDMKRILLMAVQACSVLGIVALGLTTASKVKMELSLCAIWG